MLTRVDVTRARVGTGGWDVTYDTTGNNTNGHWYGIETKGDTVRRSAPQKKFDDWLNLPGNTVATKGDLALKVYSTRGFHGTA
ncbi:hypothetical protein ABTX35_17685 [Streptomyces sp. NPDC096080]|uniref:hypothetical protein n=1 Tax=Streptomyces sp. NPDC096080 TaxID=3156693 RepID=UPI003322549A